jgi:outer membrane murein-binding lipoprotein Lpp
MSKSIKLLFILLASGIVAQGIFIYKQNLKIKKLATEVEEINSRVDLQVDLSDIESKVDDFESRIDDLESENETLKRKVNTTNINSDFDAYYENRKLKRRIEELESKSNN